MKIMRFTTAIFDMDGTLFDTERLAIDALQGAFREYDLEVPRQTLETLIGGGTEAARSFLSHFTPPDIEVDVILRRTGVTMKKNIEEHGLPVKPGAIELLTLFRDRGIAIGLATSSRTKHALDNLKRVNIADYFQSVIGGDLVDRSKPYPDIYLKALAELRVGPNDAIALEDSDNGIQAAHAAGLRIIHVPDIKRIDEKTRACVHREYASLLEFRDEMSSCTQLEEH
jgi:HAD superfamily hydrolase (TIGR01509 family)